MRVLVFLPNLGGGGAQAVTVRVAEGLAERGHDVVLAVAQMRATRHRPSGARLSVVDLGARRVAYSMAPLARLIRSCAPDVVVSALHYANVTAGLSRCLGWSHVPWVVIDHSTYSDAATPSVTPLIRQLMKWTYPRADMVASVSAGAASSLSAAVGIPTSEIAVLPNPVIGTHLAELAALPTGDPWFDEPTLPVVMSAGRLAPEKNIPLLLRALHALRPALRCRAAIFGEGPERERLTALAHGLSIADDVRFYGYVPNIASYMSRAALFALTSSREALPTVLIEALTVGAPVVATNCVAGPGELLGSGRFGRLVDVGDEAGLARAIADAIAAPVRPLTADLERHLAPFRLETAVAEYERALARAALNAPA